MKERGSGPIEDSLDVTLHVVLMMSTDPREAPKLMLIVTISDPFFGGVGVVDRGKVLPFDAVITQRSFKRVFAPQGFSRHEVCLVLMENEICCMVNEYSNSSNKLSQFVFLAQCMSQLSESGGHVLVTRDGITRPKVASGKKAFPEGGIWMLWVDGSDPFLFGILTCFTFWRLTAGRTMVNRYDDAFVRMPYSLWGFCRVGFG